MRIAPMEDHERDFARHVKLASLIIIAADDLLPRIGQGILIPFALAVALSYLLTPLIDLLTCRGRKGCRFRPRFIAGILSLMVAASVLTFIALVLVRALTTFKERSDVRWQRVGRSRHMISLVEQYWPQLPSGASTAASLEERPIDRRDAQRLPEGREPVGDHPQLLKANAMEDVMYIVLFGVFMLAHHRPTPTRAIRTTSPGARWSGRSSSTSARAPSRRSWAAATRRSYSRWASTRGGSLACSPSFNFIPNVGGMAAVLLPLPLVASTPPSRPLRTTAFVPLRQPLRNDLREPILIGQLDLAQPRRGAAGHPICGSVWGIVGMVMAILLTAVMRIYSRRSSTRCRSMSRESSRAPARTGTTRLTPRTQKVEAW